jgi:hypothetical protein
MKRRVRLMMIGSADRNNSGRGSVVAKLFH